MHDCFVFVFFFFKQKTAYEMRISDWSSDVCSSDLKPRSTPRCVPSCGRFAFFFPPPNPPLVSTLPNLSKNGRKQRFDSGGKLVECRLFRVVVSHGKVGSDALCILLNFLWADKATVRHEPQRINASGNAHKRERGDFVHSISLSCRSRNQHDSRGASG